MSNLTKKRFFPKVETDMEMEENFAEIFENQSKDEMSEGKVVTGTIIGLDKEYAIIDVGLKNEGRVPFEEFFIAGKEAPVLNVGDKVDVFIEAIESRGGQTILSREKAIREKAWGELEQAKERGENVDGVIFSRVKGGFTVDLSGVIAFLPGSQVDVRPIKDITPLMNVVQPFQILKMDKKLGNIVVSRRAILEESRAEAREKTLASIEEGQVMEGVVKNITDYGAFIDLGNVDGLLHVTDISWSRINHPSEVLSLGQSVQVMVIKFNEENKRISLGMKQLEKNPWEGIEERYPVGTRMSGKVTNITDYGAFVELEPGIEGLVHVSEISWTRSNQHPRKLLSIGQDVDFEILEIDSSKHRISLGMKQCHENPWRKFAEEHSSGEEIEATVTNVADFGVFLKLNEELDGMIHVSDIAWDEEEANKKLKEFNKGDSVRCKILSIEVDKERISLGIKQFYEDPFEKGLKEHKKGDIVTCEVTNVAEDGIEVKVHENLKAFIKKQELSSDKTEQRSNRFAAGDRLDAKITHYDPENRQVSLSVKALEEEQRKKAIKEYGSADSGASLGDILGEALNQAGSKAKESEQNSSSEDDSSNK
jgi:small subunit ribosomal protein S1